jgi:hypothetical protein
MVTGAWARERAGMPGDMERSVGELAPPEFTINSTGNSLDSGPAPAVDGYAEVSRPGETSLDVDRVGFPPSRRRARQAGSSILGTQASVVQKLVIGGEDARPMQIQHTTT